MKQRTVVPIETRFWMSVNKTPSCWLWTAGRSGGWGQNRYGSIGKGRRGQGSILAHRLSWILHFGEIPEGLSVLHKCDNTLCVNPEHLFLGTPKDNMQDMVKKGRRKGGKKPLGKNLIKAINALYDQGLSETAIAKVYNISRTHAHKYYANAKEWVKKDGNKYS